MKRLILTCLVLLTASSTAFATEFKALLVSIEKYEIAPLDYAKNDVGRYVMVLMDRYGCKAEAVIDPARVLAMQKIENWCQSLTANDTALLYLAGHGVKDDSGKLYLAMTNFNRKNFDEAAIPLEWIRNQLRNCRGKNKLLLIDTCFAGTSRSIDFEQADSGDVAKSFADLSNVVTIASSRGEEKSWLWGEARHSLFTYWLIEAFKGHADLNNDLVITCDEIVQYLQKNVPWVARVALNQDQTPISLNQVAGKDFNLPLRAISLSDLIDDVAEQIDLHMRLEKYSRIGIPEFTTGHDRTFEAGYGSLPRNVAELLRKALTEKARLSRGGYSVLNDNELREALRKEGITPGDLGTSKTKEMRIGGLDIPLLVDGSVTRFGAGGLSLRVNLIDTQSKSEIGQAGGAAILNANELAMTGISGKFPEKFSLVPVRQQQPVRQQPGPSTTQNPTTPGSERLRSEPGLGLISEQQRAEAQRMQTAAAEPHPLAPTRPTTPTRPATPVRPGTTGVFDVWVETTGSNGTYTKVPFQFRGNDCYLQIEKGKEYRIVYKATYPDLVFVRVMVDGLNTISQPCMTVSKGAYIEAVEPGQEGEYVVAPLVPLAEARPWVIPRNFSRSLVVDGFVDANPRNLGNETIERFLVVDADESVAARRNYTKQIGLITVAFYKKAEKSSIANPNTADAVETRHGTTAPAAAPNALPEENSSDGVRSIGTGVKPPEPVVVEHFDEDEKPGEMLAVYNIRYMTPEMFKQIGARR